MMLWQRVIGKYIKKGSPAGGIMAKRVLFISNVPSPYNVAYLNELGKRMDVTAVFERGFSDERDNSWKTLHVTDFKCILLKGFNCSVDSAFAPGVLNIIYQFEDDHIIIGNPSTPTGIMSILYCKLFRIPYILQSEGGIPKDGKGLKEKFKYFLMHSAKLYLSGMSLKNEYFLTYGAKPERIKQYPFTSLYAKDLVGRVPTADEKKKLRRALGIEAETMIISVGQFIHRKAFDILLKACTGLPDNCYVLIVGGEPTEEYIGIIKELGLKNIHFMSFVSREELAKYYEAADIFALPTREDTWGLVINEAMAAGLPVITTDKCVAGCELIEDGVNGYLIPTEDVDTLHQKIMKLVFSPELCIKMGLKSRDEIKDYTYENMARVIYNELVKSEITNE